MRNFVLVTNTVFLILFILGVLVILGEGEEPDVTYVIYPMLFILNIVYVYKSKEVK